MVATPSAETPREFLKLPSPLGRAITDAIADFAHRMRLEFESWILDLPLWSVSQEQPATGVVRKLQIGAYALNGGDELCVIPLAFRIDAERQTFLAFNHIDPEFIWRIKVAKLHPARDLDRTLTRAWQAALKIAVPGDEDTLAHSGVVAIPLAPAPAGKGNRVRGTGPHDARD